MDHTIAPKPAKNHGRNIQRQINGLYLKSHELMHQDIILLSKEIRSLKQAVQKKKLSDKEMSLKFHAIKRKISDGIHRKKYRLDHLPKPDFQTDLPIYSKKDEIIEAISNHPVVIISGDTGSGKTTQIPKFCLAAGRGTKGIIGCTQPRRIAATSVSRRIAEEFGENLGESVGYKIRFQENLSKNAYIKIMTDGILLAEAQNDPFLNAYDTLIIDEAHERSLNIDFILGMVKTLIQKRSDLKLVITSATIDTEKFSKAFDDAPIISVSGRSYPVKVHYVNQNTSDPDDTGYIEGASNCVKTIVKRKPYGDILVFMPTEQDIRETCELIEGGKDDRLIVLPLFGRLTQAEQRRVFSGSSKRKVIVATNVAETSITIPGIKYVVDTGLARVSQYIPRSRTTALPIVPVSKSSADQRKGRCGRLENGECFRLFSEEDYLNREEFTAPEILRSNLAEVILRMMALKLGDVSTFPFVDPPQDKSVKDGYNLLLELGAIALNEKKDSKKETLKNGRRFRLTHKGRIMAKIPLDPRLSRMLIQADSEGCLNEMSVIAAALSIQDPRERPLEKKEAADQAHSVFKNPSSDFMALLNIWQSYHAVFKTKKSRNQLRKFCKEHFLSFRRMREWEDVYRQITDILKESQFSIKGKGLSEDAGKAVFSPFYGAIHRSILSGFLSNIALRKEKQIYQGAKEKNVMIFPGSFVFQTPGQWMVAAEMVETSRLFARQVANIDVEWVIDIGKNLAKYRYDHPFWDQKREQVVASETITLFGLILSSGKNVSFGRIDPVMASEIFIQSALINESVKSPLPFMVHNWNTVENIRKIEDRIRRRDLLVDEGQMMDFYQSRLNKIYDIASLKKYIAKKKGDHFLRFKEEKLMNYAPNGSELEKFPTRLNMGDHHFPLEYQFDPGEKKDGVMVKIPLSKALSVKSSAIEWMVPGLLEEKLTLMIKGLPKAFRKRLVPVPKTVERLMQHLPKEKMPLKTMLSQLIHQHFDLHIPSTEWSDEELPNHLRMQIAVTDPKGNPLRVSRNPSVLHKDLALGDKKGALKSVRKRWERSNLKTWDFEDLPESITSTKNQPTPFIFYPGLSVAGDVISIQLFTHQKKAMTSHMEGVATLVALHFEKDIKHLKKNLVIPYPETQYAVYFGGAKKLQEDLLSNIKQNHFAKNIRSKKAYESHLENLRVLPVHTLGQRDLKGVAHVLTAYHCARNEFQKFATTNRMNTNIMHFINERRNDLTRLIPENFISVYPTEKRFELDRYMKALIIRCERGILNIEKDKKKKEELVLFEEKLNILLKSLSCDSSKEKREGVEAFFWQLEEYKISLFAQEMKTKIKISPKRLNEQFKRIEQLV